MADLNVVAITGRLTRDSELKYTQSGLAICAFSVAVNRKKKQGDEWVDEASFFDITLFGKRGESLQRYLTKGTQVAIQGELKQDRWEKDGAKRSRVGIIVNDIQLLGGNKSEDNGETQAQSEEEYLNGTPF